MPNAFSLRPIRPSPFFLGTIAVTAFGGAVAWASDPSTTLSRLGAFVFVLAGWVATLSLHEFGHAFTAWRFGDHDVALRGYLDLDMRRYADPVNSLVIPLALVLIGGIGLPGAAVYLDTRWMSKEQRTKISLAGPAMNLLAAACLLLAFAMAGSAEHLAFWAAVEYLGLLQVFAVVLNLLPIPGLDGYGALEPWLSPQTQLKLQPARQWSFLILLGLLLIPNPLGDAFYSLVYWVFGLLGGNSLLASLGGGYVRFWR